MMHHQFNIQQLYVLLTVYLCVLYLFEKNSDLCHLQHKLIGFIAEMKVFAAWYGLGLYIEWCAFKLRVKLSNMSQSPWQMNAV